MDDYRIIGGGRTYRYFEGQPLFPFGHGLGYSSFAYGNLRVTPDENGVRVSFNIKNTGGVDSDEVAQVYITAISPSAKRPRLQLVGFKRLSVREGMTEDVECFISNKDFAFYDVRSRRMITEAGEYRVAVGPSSGDLRLSANVSIVGETVKPRDVKRLQDDMYNVHVPAGETIIDILPQRYVVDGDSDITDPVFHTWCEEQMDEWDTDDNGKLSPDEAADVTEIVCSGTYNANKGIESLKGIEHFTGLTTLDCSYNKLSSFDVSKNSALTELYCTGNLLTALDVSKNIALTNLNCTNNPGDGESQFPVKVWPEFTTPPVNFTTTPWNYGGKTITPAYSK